MSHRRTVSQLLHRSMDTTKTHMPLSCHNSPTLLSNETGESQGRLEDSQMGVGEGAGVQQLNNMFELLHLALAEGPVCVEIPETIFVSESGRDCLLFNDEKKVLRAYESSDVLTQFLVQCSYRVPADTDSNAPLYIFFSQSCGFKVIFDSSEAEKVWRSTRERSKRMQRFIATRNTEPTKIRIVWKRSGEISRFRIQKKAQECGFRGRKAIRSNTFNSVTSAYKYDLSAFNHAGQLKKSSFSPLLPFKSVLMEEISQKHTVTKSPRQPSRLVADSFLVSSRSPNDYKMAIVIEPIPKAERISQVLREVLQRFLITEDDLIETLAYDVIQSVSGEYLLLNTKWMMVCKRPVYIQKPMPHTKSMQKKSTTTPDRERSLRKKFSEIVMSPPSEAFLRKAPFIDMKDIQSQRAKVYMASLTALPKLSPLKDSSPVDPMLPHLRSSLDSAESKLDSMLSAAIAHRIKAKEVESVRLGKYSEKMLDQVLTRVYERVKADPELGEFFKGKDASEINMIKRGFAKAFSGVDNFYFKRNVKRIHEGMGISSAVFSQFLSIFSEVLHEEGVHSDDIAIFHTHLTRFSELVVEDDDEVS